MSTGPNLPPPTSLEEALAQNMLQLFRDQEQRADQQAAQACQSMISLVSGRPYTAPPDLPPLAPLIVPNEENPTPTLGGTPNDPGLYNK